MPLSCALADLSVACGKPLDLFVVVFLVEDSVRHYEFHSPRSSRTLLLFPSFIFHGLASYNSRTRTLCNFAAKVILAREVLHVTHAEKCAKEEQKDVTGQICKEKFDKLIGTRDVFENIRNKNA